MKPLERMRQVIEDRHRYAREWKARTGGKVVGYLCTYFPEEVVYAAGTLPVRLLGGHEPQDITEPHIFGMYCPYSRDCLAQGLLGRYDYLDGVMEAYSCVHLHQTFDSWRRHIPLEIARFLFVPPKIGSRSARATFLEEVRGLVGVVERWRGVALDGAALGRAIKVFNENRRLLAQLFARRRQDPPGITGTAALEAVLSSQLMDKEEHNQLLQELVAHPPQGELGGPRILVLGSVCDQVEVVRLIEGLGARVVADDLCTGLRYFQGEVAEGGDPVPALVDRYLNKPPCPLKDLEGEVRQEHLARLLDEYRVKGVIQLRQKFCDPHAYDYALLAPLFRERGVPTLSLELDFTIPLGQYRTRVEALLEMMEVGESSPA